ncbi:MAG: response regulator [candidate division Zixibacteria bacterium]|nr:response regulator [candidate division Zixibacteria bacterium]
MKKILVVGKNPKVCEDLRKYFDPQEYKLLSSYDPKNIVTSLINLKPDLIILDLNSPDHSGIEVLKKLNETNSDLPIIAITDSLSNLNNLDIIKEKVYGFVKRPIRLERLSDVVKEALSSDMNRMVHIPATTGREKRESKVVAKFSGLSESPEKVKTDCEEAREKSALGEKDYDQMFDQILTSIYDEILVSSKGNIYAHLISGLEKSLISLTLKYCNHNQVKASQIMGISRNTLRERIKRYDLW